MHLRFFFFSSFLSTPHQLYVSEAPSTFIISSSFVDIPSTLYSPSPEVDGLREISCFDATFWIRENAWRQWNGRTVTMRVICWVHSVDNAVYTQQNHPPKITAWSHACKITQPKRANIRESAVFGEKSTALGCSSTSHLLFTLRIIFTLSP